jgi:hypothetical protein
LGVEAAAEDEPEQHRERGDESDGAGGDADDARHQCRPIGGGILTSQAHAPETPPRRMPAL